MIVRMEDRRIGNYDDRRNRCALVAVAFAVLVGYLVPVLMQIRKTVAESNSSWQR